MFTSPDHAPNEPTTEQAAQSAEDAIINFATDPTIDDNTAKVRIVSALKKIIDNPGIQGVVDRIDPEPHGENNRASRVADAGARNRLKEALEIFTASQFEQ